MSEVRNELALLRLGFANVSRDNDELLAEREKLRAEVERLTACLHRANQMTEHFEREWYLRGDEIEELRALLAGGEA